MGKKLYVGNLAYTVTDSELQQMFEPHGTVQSAQVIMDRDTGRSKGFGFVEMGSDAEAQAAITAFHGTEHGGRTLTVNEARPKPEGGGRRIRRRSGRRSRWRWRSPVLNGKIERRGMAHSCSVFIASQENNARGMGRSD